jgi:hypothetical protein
MGRQEETAREVIGFQFDRRILCEVGTGHMRATALDDLLGMPWQKPVPKFVGDRKIFESLVAVLGRIDDGGQITGEDDRAGHALHFSRLRLDDNIPRFSDFAGSDWELVEAEFLGDLFAALGRHLQLEASHVPPLFLVLNHGVDDVLDKKPVLRAQLVWRT